MYEIRCQYNGMWIRKTFPTLAAVKAEVDRLLTLQCVGDVFYSKL